MLPLDAVRRALDTLACALSSHRYVVWAQPGAAPSARHPHLGAWARCARCGAERDWLFQGVGPDDVVRDHVHGGTRRLCDLIAVARGEIAADHRVTPDPIVPVPQVPSARTSRPLRRGPGEARGSRSKTIRDRSGRGSERDPST